MFLGDNSIDLFLLKTQEFKYFSLLGKFPFHFVDCLFCYAQAFKTDLVVGLYFCFSCQCFLCHVKKNHCWNQHQRAFPPCFLPGEFFGGWMFKSHILVFWINFCELRKIEVQNHYCACEHPVSSHHLLKMPFFLHCVFLVPLSNISWLFTYMWVSFWALHSVPPGSVSLYVSDILFPLWKLCSAIWNLVFCL